MHMRFWINSRKLSVLIVNINTLAAFHGLVDYLVIVVDLNSYWSIDIHANLANPGALFGPWAWIVMTIGISALILGLWPMHVVWTYYCIIR